MQFVYRKFDLTQEQLRKVQPCALKEFKGRWYLLAMEVGDKGKMKAWGLDRISDLQMTRELFDKDPAFTVGRSYQDCFGIFAARYPDRRSGVVVRSGRRQLYRDLPTSHDPGNHTENGRRNPHPAACKGNL